MCYRILVTATISFSLAAGFCQVAPAVKPDVAQKRRFSDSDIKQGRQSINAFCSRCHGKDGKGAKGPDLTDAEFIHGETDEDIVEIISNGISGTGMMGFGANYEDYYWPVVAYIRDEQKKQKEKVRAPAGNIANGYELFKKHQCASCHWLGGEGGRRGTNLSQLTATADYVRESMRNPNSQIDVTYQSVSLLDKEGRVLTGRRMNENSYFVLLMDNQENLHAIAKADLDEIIRPHVSIMPSLGDQLSEQDIEDITTYLLDIRKAKSK